MNFIDLKQSKGNFFKDTDGNVILDLNCPLPLGYNHDVLINARDSALYDRFLQGSVDVSSVPPHDFAEILSENVMPVAPSGLNQVHLSDGNSTTANEVAISTAIMQFAMQHRKDNYSNLSVMGFSRAAHGSSVATLSCSDAAANASRVPTYDWPIIEVAETQLPFARYEKENLAAEEEAVEEARKTILARRDAGRDVAAIIVEPQSSLGMWASTPAFFKSLRRLAKTEGIPFIVDETKTGFGQTGKMWGHEHWHL